MKPLLAIVLLCGLAACSSSTTPESDNTTMQFRSGQSQTYESVALDTLPGEPEINGSAATSVMTIDQHDVTLFGRQHVSMFRTIDQSNFSVDTGYYSQDTIGDLYTRDFGLALINSNPLAQSFLGGPIHTGWILEAKMKSAAGASWVGFDTTLSVTYLNVSIPIHITDHATMMSDTSFTIAGNSYVAKHAKHLLTMDGGLAGSWHSTLETYISAQLGATVLTINHPSQATSVIAGTPKFEGIRTLMISHN